MEIEQVELTPEQLELDRSFLEACRQLNLAGISDHIDRHCDTWFQDPETGNNALHTVVEAAHANAQTTESHVVEILNHLLANGVIWNQLSKREETPGCTARRLYGPASPIYNTILQAGIRAELLLAALDRRDASSASRKEQDMAEAAAEDRNAAFLSGKLEYVEPVTGAETLLDAEANAVMMSWETDIMLKSAAILCPEPGRSVLNIGFGLGIIDTAIQERHPSRHVIVEAHPDVLARMKRDGWYERPGVTVLEGRWQDVVDDLANRETFDSIYYDPFEYWEDMHAFFDSVVALLNPDGIFSFFHGLGADNQTFYDVYTNILEIELAEFGLEVAFQEMPIETTDEEWKGAKRRYWRLDRYRLPTCRFIQ